MSDSLREASPLAQLNAYIRERVAQRTPPPAPGETADGDELPSVRRFRRAWTRVRAQEQVEQAVARRPAQAGPLNSHALVLQSLATMRALSPEYLRRFVEHVETLQWLEQVAPPAAAPRTPRKRATSKR